MWSFQRVAYNDKNIKFWSNKPGSDQPKRGGNDTDKKLQEKEAELARMQEMLLQMQKQLQMQNQPPSSHNVWVDFSPEQNAS